MSSRKQRMCKQCGKPFKSWHSHVNCAPVEAANQDPPPKPERPPFRPRIVAGNSMVWVRDR